VNRLEIRLGIGIMSGIALGFLAFVYLPGCTKPYAIDVRGTVKDAADGTPLAGVLVWPPLALQAAEPVTTGNDGRFSFGPHDWDGRYDCSSKDGWLLALSRGGAVAEVVDINPGDLPTAQSHPLQIVVVVYMRAKP
jgi:hypothetical protein